MSTQVIAGRYADALFDAARGAGDAVVGQVDGDLEGVVGLMADSKELRQMWLHPVVGVADKQDIARKLLAGKVHPYTLNTILLLFDKKRGNLLEGLQAAFRERYDATRRRATVKVTSALALEPTQAEQLRHELATKLAKDVQVETAVDSSLIGGLVVQIDDQVIDNSLKARLEALRQALN